MNETIIIQFIMSTVLVFIAMFININTRSTPLKFTSIVFLIALLSNMAFITVTGSSLWPK